MSVPAETQHDVLGQPHPEQGRVLLKPLRIGLHAWHDVQVDTDGRPRLSWQQISEEAKNWCLGALHQRLKTLFVSLEHGSPDLSFHLSSHSP